MCARNTKKKLVIFKQFHLSLEWVHSRALLTRFSIQFTFFLLPVPLPRLKITQKKFFIIHFHMKPEIKQKVRNDSFQCLASHHLHSLTKTRRNLLRDDEEQIQKGGENN